MLTKGAVRTKILLVIGILVLLNLIGYTFYKRFDFTGDQRYTLSKATDDILKELEQQGEPLTIKAYFSEGLPTQSGIDKLRNDFKETIIEYKNLSGGLINYEFINPNEDAALEQEAQQAGIPPQMLRVRESDQLVQKRVYFGAQFLYGDQTEVLPSIPPGAALEYALSSTIKKMAVQNKSSIGFVQGHGEPSIAALQQAAQELGILYNIGNVNLNDTSFINTFKSIAIVAPTDSFTVNELNNLDQFLAQGKGVCVAINRVGANLGESTQGFAVTTGLETWLEGKGIVVEPSFLMDQKCGNVTVQQQMGFLRIPRQIPFPYLPNIQNFADHPITNGIESVVFPFASAVGYNAKDANAQYTPLVFSSNRTSAQAPPNAFDISKEWRANDFQMGKQSIGAVLEGNLVGDIPSRLVVYGDGDFATNGEGRQAQNLSPNNVSLLVNAIDWLSDDTGLNELRTKAVTSRPLNADISDSNKLLIKIGNFVVPILLVVLYGVYRWVRRGVRRRKWMNEKYG